MVQLARCRKDPVAFAEYVLGVVLDEIQREWLRVWERERESVLHGAVGMGKSMLARVFVLWLIGNDPGEQVIWLSATQRQPKKSLHIIKSMIEDQRSRVHHVFPSLRPGKLWRQVDIEVDRDVSATDGDPTIAAYGAYSEAIVGSRATTLVIDDLCNFTNTLTEDGRTKMIKWLGSVFARLVKLDVRIIVLGNYWHRHDATEDFRRKPGVYYMRAPAFYIDEETGERVPTAPHAMSLEQIADQERRLGPVDFDRLIRCMTRTIEAGRFRSIWFDKALDRGRGQPFRPDRVFGAAFAGVDLGHSNKPGSDRTAIVTAMLLDDGRKQIIDVRSGLWTGPEIGRQINEVRLRYGATIGVENNSAQQRVLELVAEAYTIPLKEHHTGINKHDQAHGVESLATELAQGHWIFPCPKEANLDHEWGLGYGSDGADEQPHEEIQGLVNEALVFDPTKHAGDRLMAWWICTETMRKSAAAALCGVQASTDVVDLSLFDRL